MPKKKSVLTRLLPPLPLAVQDRPISLIVFSVAFCSVQQQSRLKLHFARARHRSFACPHRSFVVAECVFVFAHSSPLRQMKHSNQPQSRDESARMDRRTQQAQTLLIVVAIAMFVRETGMKVCLQENQL